MSDFVGTFVAVRPQQEGTWGAGLEGAVGRVVRHEDRELLIARPGERALLWFSVDQVQVLTVRPAVFGGDPIQEHQGEHEDLALERLERECDDLSRNLDRERDATRRAWAEGEAAVARAWREAASPHLRQLVALAATAVDDLDAVATGSHHSGCVCSVCALRAHLAHFRPEPST